MVRFFIDKNQLNKFLFISENIHQSSMDSEPMQTKRFTPSPNLHYASDHHTTTDDDDDYDDNGLIVHTRF